MRALGRLPQGTMNQLEAKYDAHLKARHEAAEVQWWKFEGMKFRLANSTFYTPDFVVMVADGGIELHEVKGFWQDDARVKIKVAAEQFPLFVWRAFTPKPKKDGGGWKVETFGAWA